MTSFLFAGQAAEEPRMGLAVADRWPAAAHLLDVASEVIGRDVRQALRRGRLDADLQPILVAVQLGAVAALAAEGVVPDVVAGHSLGELAAWSAAGGIRPEMAIRVAQLRGQLMTRLVDTAPGGLVAVGVVPDVLPKDVVVAAENAPDETILSGPLAAIEGLGTVVQRAGAWHHPSLQPAVEPLRAALEAATHPAASGAIAFVSNRDGRVADPAAIPRLLAEQLIHPVRFMATLAALPDPIVIVGPGRVLRNLLRRNGRTALIADHPDAIIAAAARR